LALVFQKRHISCGNMRDLIGGLKATASENAYMLYLPPGLANAEIENYTKILGESPETIVTVSESVISSKTGAVIIWGPSQKLLLIPPFPISEKPIMGSKVLEQLHKLLSQEYIIALVLVRLGSYAIGVYRGEKRLRSKVGTGLVHGRHRQGGSSAHRFERHRDKQIEYFLTRVCQHAREQIEPYAKSLDYIVYGGARTTIQLLQKQCHLLNKLETPALPPLLDIPEPRQLVLENAISRVWSSTICEWQEG
jgi:hypothetical protein